LVHEIYEEVTVRYLKMGARQFLCDFHRDYHIKKSLAHRKAVTQRKQKANEKRMKVHFQHIEQDRSLGKKVSHVRLLSLVNELKDNRLMRLYPKNELQRLCSGYNVSRSGTKENCQQSLHMQSCIVKTCQVPQLRQNIL
jgi:hypothetical protein